MDANPIVLSYDQRLFAFAAWRNWLPPDRLAASALIQWDTRQAELQQLASVSDPTAFADQTAHTEYGSIDAFVLQKNGPSWDDAGVAFSLSQFDPNRFAITTVTSRILVAVRKPGT